MCLVSVELPSLVTSSAFDVIVILRYSGGGDEWSGLAVSAAAAVNQASDIALPARNPPTVQARTSPPEQSSHGKEHRLPSRIGDTDRIPTCPRCRRGGIDVIAITVHPNLQRITGFGRVSDGESVSMIRAVDLPSGIHDCHCVAAET